MVPLKTRKDEGRAEEDKKSRQAGKHQYHLVSVMFKRANLTDICETILWKESNLPSARFWGWEGKISYRESYRTDKIIKYMGKEFLSEVQPEPVFTDIAGSRASVVPNLWSFRDITGVRAWIHPASSIVQLKYGIGMPWAGWPAVGSAVVIWGVKAGAFTLIQTGLWVKWESSDGGSWSLFVGCWRWDSDGELYWQSFASPKLWSEGSQSKGDKGEEPLPWTLFSPYFIQRIAALSLSWAITFPSQKSQHVAVLQRTFSWRSLPSLWENMGKRKRTQGWK